MARKTGYAHQQQQIPLDLDDRGDTQQGAKMEPERIRQMIELMTEAIVAVVQADRRTGDDGQ